MEIQVDHPRNIFFLRNTHATFFSFFKGNFFYEILRGFFFEELWRGNWERSTYELWVRPIWPSLARAHSPKPLSTDWRSKSTFSPTEYFTLPVPLLAVSIFELRIRQSPIHAPQPRSTRSGVASDPHAAAGLRDRRAALPLRKAAWMPPTPSAPSPRLRDSFRGPLAPPPPPPPGLPPRRPATRSSRPLQSPGR